MDQLPIALEGLDEAVGPRALSPKNSLRTDIADLNCDSPKKLKSSCGQLQTSRISSWLSHGNSAPILLISMVITIRFETINSLEI